MSSNYETVEFFKEERRRHQSSYKSDGESMVLVGMQHRILVTVNTAIGVREKKQLLK
jgi:hypothetical protein